MAERISDSEQAVMEVLWAEAPLTSAEVVDRIDPARGWTDRTIKTLLSRLVAKGALAFEEAGRRYLYRPVTPRDQFVTEESNRLIDRLFAGRAAPLVAHLAERDRLTRDDIAEIEALLKELKA